MKKLVLFAVLVAGLAACNPQIVEVEKIVNVEVDKNPMPDSLRHFFTQSQEAYERCVNYYVYDPDTKKYIIGYDFLIISFGKNSNALNSNYPNGTPMYQLSFQYFEKGKAFRYTTLKAKKSHENLETDVLDNIIWNPNFYDKNQYVYKIIAGKDMPKEWPPKK